MFGQNAQMPNLQRQRTIKRKFTKEEDKAIEAGVKRYGEYDNKWELISINYFQGTRTPRQCRDRYRVHLDPNTAKKSWTKEEDSRLKNCVEKFGTCFAKFANQFPDRSATQLHCHYLGIIGRIKAKHNEDNDSKFNALPEEIKHDIYECLIQEGSYTNFSQEIINALNQSEISITYLSNKFGVSRQRLGDFLEGKDQLTRRFGPTKAQEMIANGYKQSEEYPKKDLSPVSAEKLDWYNQGQQNQLPQSIQQVPQQQPLNQHYTTTPPDITNYNQQQLNQLPPISTIIIERDFVLPELMSAQQEINSIFSFSQPSVQQTNTNQQRSVYEIYSISALLNSTENGIDNLNNSFEVTQSTNSKGGVGK